eukprot:CAMPEP_0183351916 /NCGR_PEP_ID=MMETSP0164_2-20130417/26334_1 /TAXON_ID=221442 /ORGANISM="Coccolithus pelagicus ssp braarudi, Strain PLY182g" /LENGTH=178 /DNA_ID=CAMNT_0025524221 /DNA_START=44 /DNA_END=580 /DNA_ORIENTATION=+
MASTHNKQYEIVGRHKPTEKNPSPKVYRMKLFAPNKAVARSRFWYYLSLMKKVKKANGEVLETHEIFEKKPNVVKNFGIWIRYDSRSGTHNMYKEYRDTTLNGAVDKMYSEMASRHRARRSSVQIIRTARIAAKDTRRDNTKQFLDSKIRFRLLHRIPRAENKRYTAVFRASAPSTFF